MGENGARARATREALPPQGPFVAGAEGACPPGRSYQGLYSDYTGFPVRGSRVPSRLCAPLPRSTSVWHRTSASHFVAVTAPNVTARDDRRCQHLPVRLHLLRRSPPHGRPDRPATTASRRQRRPRRGGGPSSPCGPAARATDPASGHPWSCLPKCSERVVSERGWDRAARDGPDRWLEGPATKLQALATTFLSLRRLGRPT
jgi:hypothetical protein